MLITDRRVLLPFLLVAGALAAGCQSRPTPPPAPPPISEDVWATIDGREIRSADVDKAYRRTQTPPPGTSDEEILAAKLTLLDQMITEDIILAKAKELKIEVPETEIDTSYNEGRKNVADDALNTELASRNLTIADMREGVRRELLAQKVMEREVTSNVTVTDQEITTFFETNKAQFNLTEDAYHLAQILVTPVKDPGLNNRTGDDAASVQAANAKMQMLVERLKAGAQFADVAMDYSEDPQSAPQGGDLGLVPISALRKAPPQLRDAVLKLQPGAMSVVGMDGGYTLVALVAKQAKGQRDLSMPEVKNGIRSTLQGRREGLLRTAYLEAVRNRATVVNHEARRIADAKGKLPVK